MDPVKGVLTRHSFTVKYHYVQDSCYIVVLRQTFDTGLLRNWQPNERYVPLLEITIEFFN